MAAGVDGCPAGWVVATGWPSPAIAVVATIAAVMRLVGADATVAVDIPIGLPDRIEGPGRPAEQAVRSLLGGRQSSVFSVPARDAVWCEDYREACAIAALRSTPPRRISKQAFMLFRKICEVDAFLRGGPGRAERLLETHPEVVFWALNGGRPLAEPKKVKGRVHGPGMAERIALLERAGLVLPDDVHAAPAGSGRDDVVDALACLVVARDLADGHARPFPSPPARDRFGLPIAIWAPRPR